jgi:hypothetical protein
MSDEPTLDPPQSDPPPPGPKTVRWVPPLFICHRQDFAGEQIGAPCPEPGCGHSNLLHMGVEACVVCELVALRGRLAEMTTAEYWRKQARVHGTRWPY